jgi:hypothetical protein
MVPAAVAAERRLSRADDVRLDWNCVSTGFGATMVPVAVAAEERLSRADDVRLDCLDGG